MPTLIPITFFGLQSLIRKLDAVESSSNPEATKELLAEADGDVYEIRLCLQNFERETRHFPYQLKSKSQKLVKDCREDMDGIEGRYRELQASSTRRPGAGGGNNISRSDRKRWKDQRGRLLETKDVVDETSQSLMRTQQALNETTQIGADANVQLVSQREQLIHAQETILETDDFLVKSAKTLRRIRRRVVTNKLIQFFIIFLELGVIGLVIYFKHAACCKTPK